MVESYRDPIERFTAEVEVFGMAQMPGQPAQTEAFFQIRQRQDGAAEAAMGLPAYKGDKGDRGPATQIYLVATSADIPSPGSLSDADIGKGWRVEGSTTVKFWTNIGFVTHPDWLGVEGDPGPPGPAANLTAGSIEMLAPGVEPTFDITGTAPNQVLSLGIPTTPGLKGDTGPAAAIEASEDYEDDGTAATAGQVLAKRTDGSWGPRRPLSVIEEYVIPPASFPNASKNSSDQRHQLLAVPIPAKDYPYRFDFSGGVDVDNRIGHQVDTEIRLDNAVSGTLVGLGKGQDSEGWREVQFRAHSNVAYQPGSTVGVITPGTSVTVYVSAVLRSGFLLGWAVRNTNAQLRIQLIGAA
ncbi:hypothetical protein [Cellulomonas sp. NPDC058312]|uniref:hypothetical protein n=1 Tax=Cellulomonas sp. NPDC058312 TaxID=3346441 RepID=UPI0036E3C806